ncbi:putative nuclease HARBI1 [Mytilus edulis]|uniref:putative nuclease HARBI1 n=1 Tax=Mytilus edulis TaxID=6550 RepID=UPI0039EE663B
MKVQETVDMFFQHKGFPGVLGAIDGSHIPIKTPKVDGEQYYNRKKFPSIILQAVCDKNLHFLDFYCGWPGSVHDSRVLKNSPLFTSASDNKERMFPGNTHLIGDAAYALSQWVMTPFKDFGNLSAEQKRYNYIHSSSRMCIDRAFGALKGRFRRLRYIDMKDMPEVVKFVLSCCTLHEVSLANFDDFDEYIEESQNANEEINDFQDFLRRRHNINAKF